MRFWNFIKNDATDATEESIELRISGPIIDSERAWLYEWFGIEAASPNAFREALAEHKGEDITVWIDSNGGSVFAAAGIYNALKEHKGKVTVKIDSKAMSAASVIAMAGDEIHMSPLGIMMIHNPLTYAEGDMREMRKVADVLDAVKDTIINAYAAKTKRPRDVISQMMDDETWMSANVAHREGFVDEIMYEPLEIANMKGFDFTRLDIANDLKAELGDIITEGSDTKILKAKLALECEL